MYKTFDEWLEIVDKYTLRLVGMTTGEMPDWDWYLSYDSGDSPYTAAKTYLLEECAGMGIEELIEKYEECDGNAVIQS